MHCKEWSKRRRQILLCVETVHGLGEAAQRDIEELLHHLIADNPAARLECISDQLLGLRSLLRRTRVERIYEDVGIEEEPTARSSRPE